MSYLTRWVYSTSHKDIAILYSSFGLISGIVAVGMSVIIRMELTEGNSQFLHENNQIYNTLITAHGLLMMFFFVMPILIGGFGKIIYIAPYIIYKYYFNYYIYLYINNYIHYNYNNSIYNKDYNIINYGINNNLCSYLTGLIEGDGSIYINNNININRSPKISIVFKNNDYELALYLKNIFNIGNIIKRNNSNVYIWQIQSIEDLYKLLYYTNGYYRTPKYYLIKKAIKWINDYIDRPQVKIKNNFNIYNINIRNNILSKINKIDIKSIDKSNILNNAWLAGFSDADSYFGIIINKSKNNESISLRYSLEIRQNMNIYDENKSFYPIMLNIATAFNSNIYSRSRNLKLGKSQEYKIYNSYIININNINKLKLINNYFSKYKLLSSKYLDYKDWNKLLNNIINNNNKSTNINIVKLGKEIRNNYNKTRTKVNFKHLLDNNIYNNPAEGGHNINIINTVESDYIDN